MTKTTQAKSSKPIEMATDVVKAPTLKVNEGPYKRVRGAKKLAARIIATRRHAKAFHNFLHVTFVSTWGHAAEHRDPTLMTNFYDALEDYPNLQTSMKQFIRRFNEEHPDCACLTFKKDAFVIDKSVDKALSQEMSAKMLKVIDALYVNPDGKNQKQFWERDIIKEEQLFSVKNFLSGFKGMMKKAHGDKDGVTSSVNAETLARGDQFLKFLEEQQEKELQKAAA